MTKRCWGCDQELSVEAFHKDKGKKDGLQSKCKACQYARYKERLAENPEAVRKVARDSQLRHRRRRLYGVSNEEFDRMVAAQEGRCLICCQVPPDRVGFYGGLVIDHDHETGCVRGLLCHSCNRALGLLGDDASTLRRALAYLMARDASRVDP